MAETRAFSANFHHIQALAMRALQSPSGIIITWTVPRDCPTLDDCKRAARSFQQSFTSFRARDRRMSARLLGESTKIPPRDSFAQSSFDRLVCMREMTPNGDGWQIRFLHIKDVLSTLNISDGATGLPLTDLGTGRDECGVLLDHFIDLSLQRRDTAPMNDDDCKRLAELRPDLLDQIEGYMAFRDKGVTKPKPPAREITDIAELGDDAFAGWKGAEE